MKKKRDYENDPLLALWFTPGAIRDHFEGDDDELGRKVDGMSDAELAEVGEVILGSDALYKTFHRLLVACIEEGADTWKYP